ncbi:MAG: NUDIX hydrolase [Desulfobacterales bacterium]|nr:NUDIX hydrolase [Desulfobacterales bacterium]
MFAKVNHTKLIHHGRVFKLITENITLPNDTTIDLDIIRHPGAAAIVPMINNKEVVLIKQYRHAVGKYIWEIPAGTLAEGESPIECAKREIVEETGFHANIWKELGEITPLPGYSDERIQVFLASDLLEKEQKLDSDEVLNVHKINFDEAINMILDGTIQDAKTIFGLFMAKNKLKL